MHQRFTTHPGRYVEEPGAPGGRRWEDGPYPPLAAMPWPIQRRWALTMLTCFNWDFVLRFWRVLREKEEYDGKRRFPADPMFSAPTEADLHITWGQWRYMMIERFRLHGLAPEEAGTSSY